MYKLVAVALGAVVALASAPSIAADNAQQDKMKACNTKAGEMKGEDRKEFMKACLSGDEATQTKLTAQQEKMKTCNQKATGMTGDPRKAFMKTCLSAKPAPPPKAESKMAMCNKQTAGMKSDERAKAQSECMKGS